MPVNFDKPHLWKTDVAQSVDFYNNWFMRFAPKTYRTTRVTTTHQVKAALERTTNLTDISPSVLKSDPAILPILRMVTAPPLARDRLIGLADVSPNLVKSMEIDQRLPPHLETGTLEADLQKIGRIIKRLTDQDLFPWLAASKNQRRLRLSARPRLWRIGCAAQWPIPSSAMRKSSDSSMH